MEMSSMIMPAELAYYNRHDTRSRSKCNGRNTSNTDDISPSAAPIICTSMVSPPDSSGCGSSPALNTVVWRTIDASSGAPATSHDVDRPAGVGVRPIRRIENTISRQVTFCKRRTRLFKKAYELAVLGDAEVAVIALSPTGRMHHYASSSMSHILERYRDWRISNGIPPAPSNPADHLISLQEGQFWSHEAFRLRQYIEHLTDLHGYFMGENLSVLPFSDIKTIETTLEAALYKTKLRKMELLQLQDQTTAQKLAEVTAIGHGPNKSSTTISTACSRTNFESNTQLMASCEAAHTSDDDDCRTVTLELGL